MKIETSLVTDETEIVPSLISTSKLSELIELSESFIAERLSVEIATDLVMDSMVDKFLYKMINFFINNYLFIFF